MFVSTTTIALLLKREDLDFVTSPKFEKGQEGVFVVLKENVSIFSGKLQFVQKLPGEVFIGFKSVPAGQWLIVEPSEVTQLLVRLQVTSNLF